MASGQQYTEIRNELVVVELVLHGHGICVFVLLFEKRKSEKKRETFFSCIIEILLLMIIFSFSSNKPQKAKQQPKRQYSIYTKCAQKKSRF